MGRCFRISSVIVQDHSRVIERKTVDGDYRNVGTMDFAGVKVVAGLRKLPLRQNKSLAGQQIEPTGTQIPDFSTLSFTIWNATTRGVAPRHVANRYRYAGDNGSMGDRRSSKHQCPQGNSASHHLN